MHKWIFALSILVMQYGFCLNVLALATADTISATANGTAEIWLALPRSLPPSKVSGTAYLVSGTAILVSGTAILVSGTAVCV